MLSSSSSHEPLEKDLRNNSINENTVIIFVPHIKGVGAGEVKYKFIFKKNIA